MNKQIFLTIFSFLISLIANSLCDEREILAIKILPTRPRAKENDRVRVEAKSNVTFQSGFSICMRVNMLAWDSSLLISSKILSLDIMSNKHGNLIFDEVYSFSWDNDIPIDPFYWNTICLTFNQSTQVFYFTINGKEIVRAINEKKNFLNQITKNAIELGGKRFTGQISDFNIWSRPLSDDEISQYSLGCNQDFVKQSKPDVIVWPDATISYKGSNIKRITVSYKKFCHMATYSEPLMIHKYPNKKYRMHAQYFCWQFKGQMIFPSNVSELEKVIFHIEQNSDIKNKCNIFWVPFRRSSFNQTKWILDFGTLPEIEVSFEPWKKAAGKALGVNCMFFNITSREYIESDCENELVECSFCQISKERQMFTLKHMCEWLDVDDKYYINQDDDGFVKLFGIEGRTNIDINDKRWVIDNLEMAKEFGKNEIANFYSRMGIGTCQSSFKCDEYENAEFDIKLHNVITILEKLVAETN